MLLLALCITNSPDRIPDHQKYRGLDMAQSYSMTVGRTYVVAGMAIVETTFWFLIRNDLDVAQLVPAALFEGFSGAVPSGWEFGPREGIRLDGAALWERGMVSVWGYPEMVQKEDHLARLLERNSDAIAIFDRRNPRRPDINGPDET